MNKTTIEAILKMAKKGGFDGKGLKVDNDGIYCNTMFGPRHLNLIEIITSKEFIDSIVKYGISEINKYKEGDKTRFIQEVIYGEEDKAEVIRHLIADAIYNNDLDSLFSNLIN